MIDATLLNTISDGCDILCVSHVAPDGDALGSLLGMGWLLRRLGKDAVLALQDRVPEEHRILPGVEEIKTAGSPDFEPAVRQHPFDLIICLDASSSDRMGSVYNVPVHNQAKLVIIDHHVTNTNFGDINWVQTDCAATCQMLVHLADAYDVKPDGELAECLLTGIVTDTLCFRTSSTNADTMNAAMRMMRGGADLSTITERTLNRKPFSLIKLWGMVLPTVLLEDRVIWAFVTRDQFREAGFGPDSVNLSSFLVTAEEADMSAVFSETVTSTGQPAVECSFRAKPRFDVSELAYSYGGGGHPPASGCTLPGALSEVMATIVPAMKQARQSQAENGAPAGGEG